MNEFIEIKILKFPKMAKCNCCNRVKDIYYKTHIKDNENSDFIVGDLDFCKQCGDNLNKILGNKNNLGEKIVKEFSF